MLSIISGLIIAGTGGAGIWYFVPRNAVVHPLAKKSLLDSLIPIAIVCALAVGISLIVTGFA
jgi:hypothetical protein